jgi:hypothetical protein
MDEGLKKSRKGVQLLKYNSGLALKEDPEP